jgi:Fic family protein
MYPSYRITKKSIRLIAEIARLIGRLEGLTSFVPTPQLRKQNKIKTIHGTLSIEGNTLSLEQITAIVENKKVIGPSKNILEVNNAITAYADLTKYKPYSLGSLCKAHKIFMNGLVHEPGKIRSTKVSILKGCQVSRVAPQPKMLPRLLKNLFDYLGNNSDEHPLIKSAVFHYEFESIHPFIDGNGRLGRFWQTLILFTYNPIFQYIPIEKIIKENQKEYYLVLEQCVKSGESSSFIEFMLELLSRLLTDYYSEFKPEAVNVEQRIAKAKKHFKKSVFSRKDYISLLKEISTATASRDLKYCVDKNLVKKSGNKSITKYRFIDPIKNLKSKEYKLERLECRSVQ